MKWNRVEICCIKWSKDEASLSQEEESKKCCYKLHKLTNKKSEQWNNAAR